MKVTWVPAAGDGDGEATFVAGEGEATVFTAGDGEATALVADAAVGEADLAAGDAAGLAGAAALPVSALGVVAGAGV
ncbi:MAG TPA: hypothetical protein VHL09_03545 [Dehalococcoidia bacterium]|nr:hypothetical protein [Dehalococcoidia bacterium]